MESYITRRPPDERLIELSETIQSQLGFRCEIEYILDVDYEWKVLLKRSMMESFQIVM